MSAFLYGLGRAVFRRRKTVLVSWLAIMVVLGGLVGLFAKPFDDAFTLPGAESQEALDQMKLTFPQAAGASGSIIVVSGGGDSVEAEPYRSAIDDTVTKIEDLAHVETVSSPFGEYVEGAVNDDKSAALINVQYDDDVANLPDTVQTDLSAAADELRELLPADSQTETGGGIYSNTSVHISWVEGVGVVIAFVVLFLTFGSALAAGIPLITALIGVAIGLLGLVSGTIFTEVSSSSPMLALMLGLAVGIDYALFIISRSRSFMAEGHSAEEAAARANATAGSAVVFAGVTVIIALIGLVIPGLPFLSVMGVGAAATVAVAVVVAVTLVPAILGFAGERIRPGRRAEKKRHKKIFASHSAHTSTADTRGRQAKPGIMQRFYAGWVHAATRVPILTIVVIVAGLGLFAMPATKLQLALPDNGSAEHGTPARVTFDLTQEYFGPGFNSPLVMTADIVTSDDPLDDIDGISSMIEGINGVDRVLMAVPNENADTAMFQIIPTTGPSDAATTEVVHALRELEPEIQAKYGFDTAVTGVNAISIDVSSALNNALLPFGIFVVGLSLVLLMMVFRSIWVPVKATFGFLLSILAAFGAVELVFIEGYGATLLNLENTGPVISFLPILLMGILFGLAMDYEVFLVSGMREAYVHGAPAREAVKSGFMNSGAVVLAAAVIMFSVFAAFVPAGEPIIKSIALGLAVGIAVDAFLVRMTLVPAVMYLLGDRAWYLPKWLDRVLPHFDVEGDGLYHQVKLKDWPHPGAQYAIYGENLSMDAGSRSLFKDINVALRPGDLLAVTGRGSTPFLLALSGRARVDTGELKIGDYVMPEQANALRRNSPYINVHPGDPELLPTADYIRGFITKLPAVVYIDHADQPADQKTATAIKSLISVALARGSAVVICVNNPDADWMIPTGTQYTLLDLEHPHSSHSSERALSTLGGNH